MMGYLAQAGDTDAATVRQAMICGSVMASFNVEDFSMDRLWRLTREEVDQRFQQFQDLTRFEPLSARG
jgi:aminoglycoside phosphotransferase family enzyme